MVKILPAKQETWVQSLGQEDPLEDPLEWHGIPLQYACLRNPMDRGAWQATVHGVTRVHHDLVTKQQQPGRELSILPRDNFFISERLICMVGQIFVYQTFTVLIFL